MSRTLLSLAGFQVIISGRFWVIAEGMRDVTTASELLKPYDAQQMRCYPISTRINHVANDDEECSAPVELIQAQARLFL